MSTSQRVASCAFSQPCADSARHLISSSTAAGNVYHLISLASTHTHTRCLVCSSPRSVTHTHTRTKIYTVYYIALGLCGRLCIRIDGDFPAWKRRRRREKLIGFLVLGLWRVSRCVPSRPRTEDVESFRTGSSSIHTDEGSRYHTHTHTLCLMENPYAYPLLLFHVALLEYIYLFIFE